jgi:stearoyl-CoA desaturase (Delta-9 desaturase)
MTKLFQTTIPFSVTYILIGIAGLYFAEFNWTFLLFWLFFAIGNGTVGHRYFSHGAFTVSKPMHWVLAFWATFAAYGTISYWQIQHRHHHRHSDRPTDIHSPLNGWWMALGGWIFNIKRVESIFTDKVCLVTKVKGYKDPAIKFTSENFVLLNVIFLACLAAININFLFYAGLCFALEQLRLGLVNTICHTPGFIGNYRPYDTKDFSHNNIFLGILGLGFGWHNSHHAAPNRLILSDKWWEIDVEGYVGKLLGKL